MKRLVLGLLVGTAALAPALAWAQQVEERTQEDLAEDGAVRVRTPDTPRPERIERREERAERRAERLERPEARPDPANVADRLRRDRDGDGRPDRRRDGDGWREARPDRMVERPDAQVFPPRRVDRLERRADRLDRRADARSGRRDRWLDARREDRQDWRDDRRDDWWEVDRRDAYRAGRDRGPYGGGLVWNRGWRSDERYDWNGYRRYNRDLYRLPRYYIPGGLGYDYSRFGLGAALPRALYTESYWIDDPFLYRLPPAYGPYRWVRYWGDALLVDLRTGRVVDAVYDIFG